MFFPVSKSRYELDLQDTNKSSKMTMAKTEGKPQLRLFFTFSIYNYFIKSITYCYHVVLY